MNNKVLGIDLSLRSTGLCCNNKFQLIQISDLNDEELIIEIYNRIKDFISIEKPNNINLEGLSLDSISRAKDIIQGNFWYLRCRLKIDFFNIPVNIVSVKSWRNPLFSKEEKKEMLQAKKSLKKLKLEIKNLTKTEKKNILLENEKLILLSNIKYQTFLKLPSNIQTKIKEINIKDGKYDLCDSYFISKYLA